MPDTGIGGTQGAVFNTILEVRVIDMVDHCGYGLFHRSTGYDGSKPIIGRAALDDIGIGETFFDIAPASGSDQQFVGSTIFGHD